ncbi:hypothetical protein K0T92_08460 [Paenibacillus oenotherae]|uniref:Uncharacterized protein n=1 Tax=Paenibacillus oenotherae TaxID=1435645 RepID=A0ABS7D4N5_9BACL|nr:hypothetical protein [Paenibacillus oenotherae]MBW7474776.1 hypothetical protein [Paenibacillus oenotherae]
MKKKLLSLCLATIMVASSMLVAAPTANAGCVWVMKSIWTYIPGYGYYENVIIRKEC